MYYIRNAFLYTALFFQCVNFQIMCADFFCLLCSLFPFGPLFVLTLIPILARLSLAVSLRLRRTICMDSHLRVSACVRNNIHRYAVCKINIHRVKYKWNYVHSRLHTAYLCEVYYQHLCVSCCNFDEWNNRKIRKKDRRFVLRECLASALNGIKRNSYSDFQPFLTLKLVSICN